MKKAGKWIALCSCCAMLAGVGVTSLVHAVATSGVNWQEITVSDGYRIDDAFVIPSRNVTVDGNTVAANVYLTYPNGTKIAKPQDNAEVTLSQAGKYTLDFEATVGSSRYKQSETFTVADKLWNVTNAKSSAEWGSYAFTQASSSGLMVRLAKGDTLTFNRVIDLSSLTSSDVLFSGFITPNEKGNPDFNKITFTLTDAYDPECYLRISGKRSMGTDVSAIIYSYWTAGGNGQALSGWEGSNYHYNDQFGTPMSHSWSAYAAAHYDVATGTVTAVKEAERASLFRIYYDPVGHVVRTQDYKIADLDEVADHPTEALWTGFKSGKVRLSVTASDYAAVTANFCISTLYGYDLQAENRFMEQDAPEISVNVDDSLITETAGRKTFIPQAVVGGNYPVPEATAFDVYSGNVTVKTTVYYNYAFPDARTTATVKNGKLKVTRPGDYTIVYSATDAMGNCREEFYWIKAVSTLDTPLAVSVSTSHETTGVCGERIAVAEPVITGGSGSKQTVITASLGNITFDVTDGTFLPENAGAWTVHYVVTDYAGISAETSYTVTVERGTVPRFVDEPVLPRYLVSGNQYVVPVLKANDYSSGSLTKVTAALQVEDSQGVHTYQAGQTFIPVASDEKPTVKLTFKAGAAEYPVELPAVLLRTSATRIAIERMFVGSGYTMTRSDKGLLFTAAQAGDFAWIFANPVVAESASIVVQGTEQSNFSAMRVTFTDYENENIAVTMNLTVLPDGCAHIAFGNTDRDLSKGFLKTGNDKSGNPLNKFQLFYTNGSFFVDSIAVKVIKNDAGKAFSGFPSGKVYVSSEIVGAENGATYYVQQFDNHLITNLSSDRTAPRISIDGVYGGMYNLGETYVLTPALVSDTVDFSVTCTVTMKNPDGTVAKDVNGLLLDGVATDRAYEVKLTSYGQYSVEYSSVDSSNNRRRLAFTVNIFDRVAPTVKVQEGWKSTASVGECITLPAVSVSDDHSALKDIVVYRAVRNPNGALTVLGYDYTADENGKLSYTQYKYTFSYQGEYTFIVCASDEAGNQTLVEYTVTVQ